MESIVDIPRTTKAALVLLQAIGGKQIRVYRRANSISVFLTERRLVQRPEIGLFLLILYIKRLESHDI